METDINKTTIKIPVMYILNKRVLDKRTDSYEVVDNILKNTKVKENYMEMFPTDEIGKEIREGLTYYDIFIGMAEGEDIYDMLDVSDSLVRERVFRLLAEYMQVDYGMVYYLWLNNIYNEE